MSCKLITLVLKADAHGIKLRYSDFSKLPQATIEMPVAYYSYAVCMVNKNHVDVLNKPPPATPQASPCSRDYFPK